MGIEGLPKPLENFKVGDKVTIPESYLTRGLKGYVDQVTTDWVIIKIVEESVYGYSSKPYAIVKEGNGKSSAASKHIPLEELQRADS